VVVYTPTRRQAEHAVVYLRSHRIQAMAYHAGLDHKQRSQTQTAFMANKVRVIVATSAFGMGVNKLNIRGVVHLGLPPSLEAYVQETGRAGRDGLGGHCHCFVATNDWVTNDARARAPFPCRASISRLLRHLMQDSKWKVGDLVCTGIREAEEILDSCESSVDTLLTLMMQQPLSLCAMSSRENVSCSIQFFRTPVDQLRTSDALIDAIAQIAHRRGGTYSVNIADLASMLSSTTTDIKRRIDFFKHTGELRAEYSNECFVVRPIRPLSTVDIDTCVDALNERVREAEETAAKKARHVFESMEAVAVDVLDDVECDSSTRQLTSIIDQYFGTGSSPASSTPAPVVQDLISDKKLAQVRSNVHALVHRCGSDVWSGRQIARLLHGLSSPCFHALQWARSEFWGMHSDVSFSTLANMAQHSLITSNGSSKQV